MEKLVVANLKMNMTAAYVNNYLNGIKEDINTKKVVICPPALYLPYFVRKKYSVGAQDCFYVDEGAYTGCISANQIASMGIKYTIIGHSERRQYFHETDNIVNKKVLNALDNDLNVILCIGETKEEKDMLKTDKILKRQLINCLRNVNENKIENVIIAYEPIWSIGTGLIPTMKEIKSTTAYILEIVNSLYPDKKVKILYGGSVNEKNIESINKIENLNGVLVGGASLDPHKLRKIKEVVLG